MWELSFEKTIAPPQSLFTINRKLTSIIIHLGFLDNSTPTMLCTGNDDKNHYLSMLKESFLVLKVIMHVHVYEVIVPLICAYCGNYCLLFQ